MELSVDESNPALQVELMWSDHVRLEDQVTQRYFTAWGGGGGWDLMTFCLKVDRYRLPASGDGKKVSF